MKVSRGFSTHPQHPITAPFLSSGGLMVEFRGGDFCHPLGAGDWFKPPYFEKVARFFVRFPVLPFISYRIGNRAGYFGAKAYGVDSPEYKNWLPAEDVFDGSQAIMFSIRPFATIK